MAATDSKWLLQFVPTAFGLAVNPGWRDNVHCVVIYNKADRTRRVNEAKDALQRGEISMFCCDRI